MGLFEVVNRNFTLAGYIVVSVGVDMKSRDADFLIGKYVLVGMTHVAPDGTVTSQEQFHGRVTKAEQNVGIAVACEGTRAGETVVLPPNPTAFQPAGPGRYTLRSTGEVIEDPDMTTSWTIHAPPRS